MNTQILKRFFLSDQGKLHIDFFSGLTVALALVPEAVAFSLVANVPPIVGLYAAFIMCFITAVLGGRPGMISGATGSMAVVMVGLVSRYGLEYLFATVMLTGVVQIVIGTCRLGKLIRMMPKSVMVGFVNGLAIVIFLAQLHQFQHLVNGQHVWLTGQALWMMIGLVIVAMIVTHYLPKVTKAFPAALTAIIVVTLIVHIGHIDTRSVKDMMEGTAFNGGLPQFHLPQIPLNWHTVTIIVPYAVVLAIIGLSESLMTLSLIDERTQTRGRGNKECIAQGIANIVAGSFKSMGGCAMIGQSMINITSGGRGRLSGITAGVFLFIFVIAAWGLIKDIPLAALVGVMFMVVIETFEWATFSFIRKIPLHDAIVIVIVTVVTVATNLAIAVVVGVIVASLVFAWQTAKQIRVDTKQSGNQKIYQVRGPLFFGSSGPFKNLFTVQDDPQDVVIDFQHSRVADHSAIEAIQFIAQQYLDVGKQVHLCHLSAECRQLLGKAGDLVEVNYMEDPDYHVATDRLA